MNYSNAAMPSDLQAGGAIKLVPVFGNTDRFDRLAPKCALLADADIGNGMLDLRLPNFFGDMLVRAHP